MFLRYFYLHRRSLPRALEIIFWPVMELLVWGFLTVYLQRNVVPSLAQFLIYLIGAMIFWDILYRSQQGVSLSVMEELWTRNIINLLISPLRMWEWIAATFIYGMVKIAVIVMVLLVLASFLYSFDITVLGFYLIPFVANLLFFGWALGTFTAGILLRWGHAAEALIWGIPFVVQPVSAIFYPVNVLPAWLQPVAHILPSTYVFEGMRAVIRDGTFRKEMLLLCLALNVLFFLGGALFFAWMLAQGRRDGRLAKLGVE